MKLVRLFLLLALVSQSFFMHAANELGSFQQIPTSPFPAGTGPSSLAFSPIASGNLFAATPNFGNNTVSVYQVDQIAGTFTQVVGSPFAAGSTPIWIDYSPLTTTGNLFAAIPNFNANTVSVFLVNQFTGAFTPVPGSPFATGTGPTSVDFSSLVGGKLFASIPNSGANSVSVFEVNQTTGAFTPVPGSPFATGANPNFAAYSPVASGNLFAAVANLNDNTVSVYSVDQTTGAFTPIAGSPFSTGSGPYSVAFSPVVSGNLFATVLNIFDNTFSVYNVNQTTGVFTPIPSSPFTGGGQPNQMAFSPIISGNLFAAIVNLSGNSISLFNVNQSTGNFTEIAGSPFATGTGPDGIAYSPVVSGNLFAATANFIDNTVSVFRVSIPTPIVTSIKPTQGPSTGGTSVTITGTNFTGASAVHFGTTAAASFIINSDTMITAISPPGSGTVDVTVTTDGGTSALSGADQFTYKPLPPNKFKGFQIANRFASQTDFVNILTWKTPSKGTQVIAYKIYRDRFPGHLIATVLNDKKLEFKDHNRRKGKTYTYFIVSVDEFQNVSEPVQVTVKPKK